MCRIWWKVYELYIVPFTLFHNTFTYMRGYKLSPIMAWATSCFLIPGSKMSSIEEALEGAFIKPTRFSSVKFSPRRSTSQPLNHYYRSGFVNTVWWKKFTFCNAAKHDWNSSLGVVHNSFRITGSLFHDTLQSPRIINKASFIKVPYIWWWNPF